MIEWLKTQRKTKKFLNFQLSKMLDKPIEIIQPFLKIKRCFFIILILTSSSLDSCLFEREWVLQNTDDVEKNTQMCVTVQFGMDFYGQWWCFDTVRLWLNSFRQTNALVTNNSWWIQRNRFHKRKCSLFVWWCIVSAIGLAYFSCVLRMNLLDAVHLNKNCCEMKSSLNEKNNQNKR